MLTAIDGHALPQLEFDRLFVTDGGIETDLTFHHGGPWRERLLGVRANASTRSHAELDEGDPNELAAQYVALRNKLPAVTVLGGCCGTDARHVAAICAAWVAGD